MIFFTYSKEDKILMNTERGSDDPFVGLAFKLEVCICEKEWFLYE